jgi:hypothetical protein
VIRKGTSGLADEKTPLADITSGSAGSAIRTRGRAVAATYGAVCGAKSLTVGVVSMDAEVAGWSSAFVVVAG